MNSALQKLLTGPEPPELGPGPRAGVLPVSDLNQRLDAALRGLELTDDNEALLRATVLLWHDHLDAAHTIAQAVETKDGSYVHAILHRREPDYGNAKYWFRRVGQHPCFVPLADRAMSVLNASGDKTIAQSLLPRGHWDSFAFVDACEAASNGSRNALLRAIQQIEFEVLLDYLTTQG